jgi:hypothetical protein
MKTKLFTAISLFGMAIGANAQINIQKRIEKEDVVEGCIIQDGTQKAGYIKRIDETRGYDGTIYHAFDNYQDDISFIPKEDFETAEEINKKMYEKYGPKEIEGYKYIRFEGDTLTYETVKYSDKSDISLRMVAKNTFLRVISKGKLSIYYYFVPMPNFLAGSTESIKEVYEFSNDPVIVFRAAGDTKSPKSTEYAKIEKVVADCPRVLEKYKNGAYGPMGENKDRSKVMKFLNSQAGGNEMKLQALLDYNTGQCDTEE